MSLYADATYTCVLWRYKYGIVKFKQRKGGKYARAQFTRSQGCAALQMQSNSYSFYIISRRENILVNDDDEVYVT